MNAEEIIAKLVYEAQEEPRAKGHSISGIMIAFYQRVILSIQAFLWKSWISSYHLK